MAADPGAGRRESLARPKINLFLHITGKRADGYHLLESLAVFAETGDGIAVEPAPMLSLSIDGPFGDTLEVSENNLVLKAAMALETIAGRLGGAVPGAALLLTKRLPVASGIGGGSADAAATLRILDDMWGLALTERELERIGVTIGADVPVCIRSVAQVMRGIGDDLTPAPALPKLWMLLVNPMRGVETKAVFAARDAAQVSPPLEMPQRFGTAGDLAEWLHRETRNDLSDAARGLMPEILEIEAALAALPGALIARMSGSGATCFALFETREQTLEAAAMLRDGHPGWWIEPAPLSS